MVGPPGFDVALSGAIGMWRSLVAHLTGGQGVAGSNPVIPTSVYAGQRPSSQQRWWPFSCLRTRRDTADTTDQPDAPRPEPPSPRTRDSFTRSHVHTRQACDCSADPAHDRPQHHRAFERAGSFSLVKLPAFSPIECRLFTTRRLIGANRIYCLHAWSLCS